MFSRSKGGGKWSSYGCDGKKSSGNSIDVNGGVSKGGTLIITHSDYSSNKEVMVQVELVEVLVVLIRTADHTQTAMIMRQANMLTISRLNL